MSWSQAGISQGSESHPTRFVVKYADLDLRRPADVIALYRRIEGAARIVCTPPAGPTPKPSPEMDACLTDAMTRAVSEIDEPALTRYFTARMRQPVPLPSSNTTNPAK